MKLGDLLSIISHLINVVIFIYFAVTLIKIDALDIWGLSVSAFAILISLLANIISILEK